MIGFRIFRGNEAVWVPQPRKHRPYDSPVESRTVVALGGAEVGQH